MASSSSAAPKLIFPEEKSPTTPSGTIRTANVASLPPTSSMNSSSNATATKKLTKILSTQTSFDRHHPPHPVAKRFSIDADPSSIILNTPVTDLSNHPSQQSTISDIDETTTNHHGKELSPARSPSLKQSDSFLEIPYEKGEIVDLIKLADDPNAAAHLTNDGHEVLLEHAAVPQ